MYLGPAHNRYTTTDIIIGTLLSEDLGQTQSGSGELVMCQHCLSWSYVAGKNVAQPERTERFIIILTVF